MADCRKSLKFMQCAMDQKPRETKEAVRLDELCFRKILRLTNLTEVFRDFLFPRTSSIKRCKTYPHFLSLSPVHFETPHFHLLCHFKKDEPALPGNLYSRKCICAPSIPAKCNVSHCYPTTISSLSLPSLRG